jgi:hypothetical protein
VVDVIQHRSHPDKATFIGRGKVEELVGIVNKRKIDIVVVNALVKPGVLFNLTQYLWNDRPDIQVWDRFDLILNIFDKHENGETINQKGFARTITKQELIDNDYSFVPGRYVEIFEEEIDKEKESIFDKVRKYKLCGNFKKN